MSDVRARICELSRHFYGLGWVSGTGGGISIREGDRVFMAPSGVQKERLQPSDIFEVDRQGAVVRGPEGCALSACAPLFLRAFDLRDAGAVIHSHSLRAVVATLVFGDEVRMTHLEMMKGLRGVAYEDEHTVPIIDNTPHECDLVDTLGDAMRRYPQAHAVLVRRHGVYVWGADWAEAKTHAECYDYLFELTTKMTQLGVDPALAPGARDATSTRERAEPGTARVEGSR
ncbi:MAG: methylthioribulose 1-phosphate dehydratase [Myxococcales bacterium]|nr:methylthioribulose 1-phosphate dehydratase [Myxococcales bacterium]